MKVLTKIFFLIFSLLSNILLAQTYDTTKYLEQTSPEDEPVLLAPGVVSLPNRIENRITFLSDGKLCFFRFMRSNLFYRI